MDWRFNAIAFDKLDQDKVVIKDFKEKIFLSKNQSFENVEYALFWYYKENGKSFENLPLLDKLLYLELNSANIKTLDGIEKYRGLKRLELHYCLKLESDKGVGCLSDSLEFLYINMSKNFKFTDELLSLKNLKVLCLNDCGPIDNLNFLEEFPNLIDFRFVNTNIVDGNLNPILEHPTIRSVGFLNKRHYNIKDEKMKSALKSKFKLDGEAMWPDTPLSDL